MDISDFERRLGVSFKNPVLLEEALTHLSYLNEHPRWKYPHNERLEFLGDAVLELAVSEYLFQRFPEKPEGELTNLRAALVRAETLAHVAHELKVNDVIRLSRGEAKDVGRARDVILANACEAIVGAIYLDQGFHAVKDFLRKALLPKLEDILVSGSVRDPKSQFQEMAQEKMRTTPSYKVISERGPDHAKTFSVGVYLGETLIAKGEGLSKQEAQQEAAREALHKKRWQ